MHRLSSPIPSPSHFRPLLRHSSTQARLTRLIDRLPRPLRPYTQRLRTAPISHIVSFLTLHEITAIVPLIGLAGVFHYTDWLPTVWVEGRYVRDGVEKFGRYFRRKGWFGFDGDEDVGVGDIVEGGKGNGRGMRILVEVATAYAITKVFLPARILLSVWATPWFARVVVGRFGGLFGRGKAAGRSAAAGTGATGGGVTGNGKP